jgi:hypothetical protein
MLEHAELAARPPPVTVYSRAPISADSVFAVSVIRGLPRPEKKNLKIKEINGS